MQAPNEAGKSTWCAFLCNMLYGLPTRDRSPLADKNRYAPWSGAAMQGRMEVESGGRDITVVRDTARSGSPMGRFSAVYTGTAEPVPELTGLSCGETLLGVPREVFERSAFVRQAGLAVGQTAELERRIVSLITTGDEDTSYIESFERLKKQLNRRQHNKTGLIPTLDGELSDLRSQLDAAGQLESQLAQTHAELQQLLSREEALTAALADHDHWDAAQQQQARQAAHAMAQEAEARADALHRRLEEDNIPGNDTIGRLRGAIVNLETVRKSVDKAREDRDNAARVLYKADATVGESPFAGQSAEAAQREAQAASTMRCKPTPAAIALFAGTLLCVALTALLFVFLANRSGGVPLGVALGVFAAGVIAGTVCDMARRKALRAARAATLRKRFGTADPAEISALADSYGKLLSAKDAAQADLAGKTAAAESLAATLTTNEQGILLEIRRFAPAAFDVSTADGLLRSCAVRRRELTEAETAAREARLRCEYQAQPQALVPDLPADAKAPEGNRPTLEQELVQVRAALAERRSAADRLTGRLHALGDPNDLRAAQEALTTQRDTLSGEYEAIALAMETLSDANTTLQNRFSPELGQRAAEIFTRLTGGKYHKVLLDRALSASAESDGDPLARDARLLSQGAFDQLYLSLRLAICDLVLPRETAAPLILDDALLSFDDRRTEAALTYLREIARERQVLLFTCQSREAAFLRDAQEVAIQTLS